MPERHQAAADAIRVMEIQTDQGWTTSTSEELARRFLASRNRIDAYLGHVRERAASEGVDVEQSSAPTDQVVVMIQKQCHWSETTCDLMALDFIRGEDLMGAYADFLQTQADEENAMGDVAGVSWDADIEDDDVAP